MKVKPFFPTFRITRASWLYYLVLVIITEKIIQHIFVTVAFYFNWTDIASEVVVSPTILMISGAIVAIFFMVTLWGMIKKQTWAIYLAIGLALFDIVGEFVAQGRIDIVITISILMATLLLILAIAFGRQLHLHPDNS